MTWAMRLPRIIWLLASGNVVTAAVLGADLNVAERTIYRDIARLRAEGLRIEGEPGVGYFMRRQGQRVPA